MMKKTLLFTLCLTASAVWATPAASLHECVAARDAARMQELLAAPKSGLNDRDERGNTALHLAAEAGAADLCRLLVSAGADVAVLNAAGKTPQEVAADAETAGDLAGASELYYRAVPLDDSLNHAYTCVYTMAEQKLSAGEYEAARELYSTLPDNYRETGDRKAETWYRPAVEAQKSSDWKTAVGLYEKCGSYSDSVSRLEKCRYELATNLQKEGSYEAAIPLFEQLGEYSDSAKQLNNCRYDLAVQSMQDGDAAKAAELFTILGTYKDSSVRLKEATAALQSVPAPEEEKTDESDFAVEDE